MKIVITYTSDHIYNKRIRIETIRTLKQLIKLFKKEGHPLILQEYDNSYSKIIKCDYELEVYDDYRE